MQPQQHRHQRGQAMKAFNLFKAMDELQRKSMQKDRSTDFVLDGGYAASSITQISQIDASEWNALVDAQDEYNPFVSHVGDDSRICSVVLLVCECHAGVSP